RNHVAVVQDVFKTLYDKGYLIKKTALGALQAATGRTLPDRYIEGTCPICGYTDARGDQCDNCGNQLDPDQLIEPRSRIDGSKPIFKETEHYYLDLPAFKQQLTDWVTRQTHWRPNVRNFSLNFIADLKPRPITRDIDWGVPVPLPGWIDQPRARDLCERLPVALRPRSPAFLPRAQRPGDRGRGLHLGGLRPAQQRRPRRHVGKSRQPHARQRVPPFRRGAAAGHAHGGGPRGPHGRRGWLRDGRRATRGA